MTRDALLKDRESHREGRPQGRQSQGAVYSDLLPSLQDVKKHGKLHLGHLQDYSS